jgi:cobalt-zinc-cadmium efflux system membrane fusion protein
MRTAIFLSLILGGAVLGCRKSGPGADAKAHGDEEHSHGAGGDHEHEEKTQITVWNNGFEIFAEHTPPVAGEPTRFITHVSELHTGVPRSAGPVKFTFRQDGATFDHPQAAPERPGIYIPAITFPSAGDWQASVIIPGATNAAVDLGVIKVYATKDGAAHAEYLDPPDGISFLKEQQWRILARTEPATRETVTERVALHATLVPMPGRKVALNSPLPGRLEVEQNVQLGAKVKAGDILGWIEPAFSEFTAKLVDAEAEALRAKSAFDQAKASLERVRNLYEQQAKSQREFQEADLAYRSAQASLEAATTIQQIYRATGATFKGGSLRIAIRAPFDGVLDKVTTKIGQRINPEDDLFTILDPTSALVQAQVPESRLARIKPELGALMQIGSEGESLLVTNSLSFVAMGRELDPGTRTVALTYAYTNGIQSITLGVSGTLLVATGRSSEALTIPTSAIVEEEGIPVVFVQLSGETFEKRDVKPGLRDGDRSEIQSGLKERERVVTDGAYAILLSTKSGTIPAHGHAH